jgi:hypothetical protein
MVNNKFSSDVPECRWPILFKCNQSCLYIVTMKMEAPSSIITALLHVNSETVGISKVETFRVLFSRNTGCVAVGINIYSPYDVNIRIYNMFRNPLSGAQHNTITSPIPAV